MRFVHKNVGKRRIAAVREGKNAALAPSERHARSLAPVRADRGVGHARARSDRVHERDHRAQRKQGPPHCNIESLACMCDSAEPDIRADLGK